LQPWQSSAILGPPCEREPEGPFLHVMLVGYVVLFDQIESILEARQLNKKKSAVPEGTTLNKQQTLKLLI
jgi:hypothetical protein